MKLTEKLLTSFLVHRKLYAASLVLVAVLLAALYLPALTVSKGSEAWFRENDPLLASHSLIKEKLHGGEIVVVGFLSTHPLSAEIVLVMKELEKELHAFEGVRTVTSLADFFSSKGVVTKSPAAIAKIIDTAAPQVPYGAYLYNSQTETVGFLVEISIADKDITQQHALLNNLRESITQVQEQFSHKLGTPLLVGNAFVDAHLAGIINRDMQVILPLCFLVAFAILLFAYRRVMVLVWPLLAVGITLTITFSLMALFGSKVTLVSLCIVALVVILVISDSMHLISTYIHHVQDGVDAPDFETYRLTGVSCFFTSLTTGISFLALRLSPIPMIQDLGVFAGFGVVVGYLATMTFSSFSFRYVSPTNSEGLRVFDHIGTKLWRVVRHNKKVVVWSVTIAATIALFGVGKVVVDGSMINYLKKKASIRKDFTAVEESLGGLSIFDIIVHVPQVPFTEAQSRDSLEKAVQALKEMLNIESVYAGGGLKRLKEQATPGNVLRGDPLAHFVVNNRKAVGSFFSDDSHYGRISVALKSNDQQKMRQVHHKIQSCVEAYFPNGEVGITGYGMIVEATTERVLRTLFYSFISSFVVILIILLALFGRKVGVLSLLPNALPLLIIPGIMGIFSIPLSIGTAIVATVAIGIIVDDTLHFFCTYGRVRKTAPSNSEAVRIAMQQTARPIILTSVLFASIFALFLLSETTVLAAFGVISAIVILVACGMDLMVGPALLLFFMKEKP